MNILNKVCDWVFKYRATNNYTKISLKNNIPTWIKRSTLRFPITLDFFKDLTMVI